MMIDEYGAPYDDFDCVAELNESFAKDGFWGRETFYGIVYAQKWILPLKGGSKRQTSAFSFVKVRDDEIRPEDKAKLEAIYVYYLKYQRLPPRHLDVVKEMAVEVAKFKAQRLRSPAPALIDPFAAEANFSQALAVEVDGEEDDF